LIVTSDPLSPRDPEALTSRVAELSMLDGPDALAASLSESSEMVPEDDERVMSPFAAVRSMPSADSRIALPLSWCVMTT